MLSRRHTLGHLCFLKISRISSCCSADIFLLCRYLSARQRTHRESCERSDRLFVIGHVSEAASSSWLFFISFSEGVAADSHLYKCLKDPQKRSGLISSHSRPTCSLHVRAEASSWLRPGRGKQQQLLPLSSDRTKHVLTPFIYGAQA